MFNNTILYDDKQNLNYVWVCKALTLFEVAV